MARYSLRNQGRISQAYGQELLERMNISLTRLFKSGEPIEPENIEGEPYPVIMVDDCGQDGNKFIFYHYQTTFDVYNLAFKKSTG